MLYRGEESLCKEQLWIRQTRIIIYDKMFSNQILNKKDISVSKDTAVVKRVYNPLAIVNGGLFLIVVFMAVYLVAQFIGIKTHVGTLDRQTAVSRERVSESSTHAEKDVKPFESYAALSSDKDMFKVLWEEIPNAQIKNAGGIVEPQLNDVFLKKVKVIGIVFDKSRQAIIENVSTGETFFLNEGDAFEDGVLRQIKEDGVVFELNGTDITLPYDN